MPTPVTPNPARSAAHPAPTLIQRPPLRGPVADELRRRIIAGELRQGERLFEDQAAAELGVSRNPVREALQQLAHEGFVHLAPRRGAWVAEYSDERARHVFEVRGALEVLVAGLAARHRTPRHLGELDEVLAGGRDALAADRMGELPALNARFHALLVDAAANPLLADMVDGLIHQIQWLYSRRVRERAAWSWEEHEQIAAAVAAQDVPLAERLSREHIDKARAGYFAAPPAEPGRATDPVRAVGSEATH